MSTKAELASDASSTSESTSKGEVVAKPDPSSQPKSKPRVLILCFDGTSDQFGTENSNVVKFYSLLKKDAEEEQLCYYQTGIGTYENPGIMSPLALWFAKIMDEAVAWYLDAHVMGGYRFLMANYRAGDRIALFGFSRGAYTARALAGMLTKVGLLPRSNIEQVPFAYKLFTDTSSTGMTTAEDFKACFCRDVKVCFVGVWDTVASTGVIMSKTLPFTQSNGGIETFRHALSLDEHRAKFVPTFYHWPVPGTGVGAEQAESKDPERAGGDEGVKGDEVKGVKGKAKRRWSLFAKRKGGPGLKGVEDAWTTKDSQTDVKEVWFAGCHTDVGGGSVANTVTSCLSDIPLRWMVREVMASNCGVQFEAGALKKLNVVLEDIVIPITTPEVPTLTLNGGAGGKGHFKQEDVASPVSDGNASDSGTGIGGTSTSSPSPSQDQDNLDCMQVTHDQLVADPAWWLLEIIPLPFSWQDKSCQWRRKWEFHLGRGRYVQDGSPLLFHESVKTRMGNAALKYTPRAKYKQGAETYVP
ncbi:hypothetical protein SCHPADRAFT_850596 [Schizopora paradoxa]|uniref:T6SS Phospholipase effector Tle1-like catalytic domain-containing protein n=1 Tax=Schizopora paradoxa TaxID=27342 RepID=A0A0H2RZ10_9AGAM|nr:hypothetical protein SCHPADRAFT_850596 [Schizopora paradoxa]